MLCAKVPKSTKEGELRSCLAISKVVHTRGATMCLSGSPLSRQRYAKLGLTFADNSSKPHYKVPAVYEPSAFLPISKLFPMTRMKSSAPIHPEMTTIFDPRRPTARSNHTPRARVTVTLNIQPRLPPAVLAEGELPRFSFIAPITSQSAIPLSVRTGVEKKQWPNLSVDPLQSRLDEAKLRIAPLPLAVPHPDDFR